MQSNHPIPQNVTQYQFRLVGDMTLKQFLELAGGGLLAWLFYSSNLIFIFKYPLALSGLLLGVALAFFPIEDRPLDVWIINFIKAIYGPTRFIWGKTIAMPSVFTYEHQAINETSGITTKTIKAPTISLPTTKSNDLSPTESAKISSLDTLLGPNQKTITIVRDDADKPDVEIRKLGQATEVIAPITKPVDIKTEPMAKEVNIPEAASVPARINTANTQGPETTGVAPTNITLPATPTTPNIISGLVLDDSGKLLENAIVQVSNNQGLPERAVKSNKLGQFSITTPLDNGSYHIEIEYDNLTFPVVAISCEGRVLQPIKIQASNAT